ncbi:MAG TPA: acyl carrier protein [Candidatus Deferrimicrobiaceae bacterium]|jgi:acyl carrier protein|nr:acyl carrier protein [Candidatus Deferrimicrobiaceae bacterium]
MEIDKVLGELKDIMVERLKFEPSRLPELSLETVLPKNIEGSLGLDSLDFIELSIGIEERFGFVIDETQDLDAHFQTLGTLIEYIRSRSVDR